MKLKLTSNQMEEVEGITLEYPYTMHCTDHNQMEVQWHCAILYLVEVCELYADKINRMLVAVWRLFYQIAVSYI